MKTLAERAIEVRNAVLDGCTPIEVVASAEVAADQAARPRVYGVPTP